MKRKELIKMVQESLAKYEDLKNVSDVEIGYTIALRHFEILLKDKKTKL